jgi:Domain of unknown function (DUF6457)
MPRSVLGRLRGIGDHPRGEAVNQDDWIAAFAAELDVEPPGDATAAALLEVARLAAHGSERTAAPIACYLVGIAGIDAEAAIGLAAEIAPRE